MKLRVEVTRHGGFALWESGSWNPKEQSGYSVIVGDDIGDPCSVLFERAPSTSNNHALFIIRIGSLVATARIRFAMHVFHVDCMLQRITLLELAPSVSGEKQYARSQTETVWSSQRFVNPGWKSALDLFDNQWETVLPPGGSNLIRLALEKAITPSVSQKIWWGVPRVRNDKPKSVPQPEPVTSESTEKGG